MLCELRILDLVLFEIFSGVLEVEVEVAWPLLGEENSLCWIEDVFTGAVSWVTF